MGAFFTNYHVRSASLSDLREALTGLVQLRAYVSPPSNGWVTVYDEKSDEQDDAVLRRIAEALSGKLGTSVIALLVHDSDVAAYWFYQNGQLKDEFNSDPSHFERVSEAKRARLRGKPDALLPLCVHGTSQEQIETILHPPEGPPIMAEDIFEDLAPLLGIPEDRICLGFTYFDDEGPELLPDISEFEPIGLGTERKESRAPDPAIYPPLQFPDTYPLAVALLAQWNTENLLGSQFAGVFSGADAEVFGKKLKTGFDRQAGQLLKQSNIQGRPGFEELKAARDQGPDAFAELVARRTPACLQDIGVAAVNSKAEQFVAALLAHGLEPNAANSKGETPLKAAERRGKYWNIYQMLKAASDARSS